MNSACIDLQALRRNYQQLQGEIGQGCQLMAVVKADGYGHGMLEVAAALQQVGAVWYGVGTVCEGKRLRLHGITGRIVVLLGGCDGSVADLYEYELEPVVATLSQLDRLQEQGIPRVAIHLKVDCGMGRLGFAPQEIVSVCAALGDRPFEIAGLMSHFPVADEDLRLTGQQAELFRQLILDVRGLGITPLAHIANSAAMRAGIACNDMVRVGIALYDGLAADLMSVMTVKSRVLQVKQVPAGTGISYGLTVHVKRDSILAVVGIGYADGYPRALSGCGEMLIDGRRVAVLGRVCMNMTVVDVTDLGLVECGDEVTVLGRQGEDEISATEIADWAGTINYEILCALGNLNPRVFTD